MSRLQSLVLIVVLFSGAGMSAHAQQATSAGAEDAPRSSTSRDTTSRGTESGASQKNPSRAVLYSVGGTVLLAPVFGAGLIVGPAFGHFYANNAGQAWNGIMLRGGAAATPVVLGALATAGSDEPGSAYAGLGVFLVSGALAAVVIVGSIIYDIVTADNAVREHNRSRDLTSRGLPTVGDPQGEPIGLSVTVQL